jgi:flagellar protein FliS
MPYDAYRDHMQQAILTADPMELVVLLYSGLQDSISQARQCLHQRDVTGRSAAVSRALEILAELSNSLDRDRGGDLAQSLSKLYDFTSDRLQNGNFRQEEAPFVEAEQVVTTLLSAWRELCSSQNQARDANGEFLTGMVNGYEAAAQPLLSARG